MSLHRQHQVGFIHADAVVLDPDQALPASSSGDLHPAGAGIDGVLDQLLDHARRPLHHLAGGDAIDQVFGKLADGQGDSPGKGM